MPGICPRCDKNVYFAEEKQALGKSWHKLCFACAKCRKMLDSGSITEHDGDMFCTACYRKNFGPKGYGFGGGAGCLSMDDGNGYKSQKDQVDHQATAYVAPRKILSETSVTNTDSTASSNNSDEKKSTVESNGIKKVLPRINSSTNKPKWGSSDICPRCDKAVFIAELMRGAGQAWHKTCFTCNACNKRLDSSMLCEREGEIFCKSCYGRNFGPKGFGYGIGAGTLQMS